MSKTPRRPAARKMAATSPSYTVRAAADVAGVEPELVQFYVENGVLTAVALVRGQPRLGDDALYELRRIEHYRRHYGVSRHALPLIGVLLREVARLEAALRFHQH